MKLENGTGKYIIAMIIVGFCSILLTSLFNNWRSVSISAVEEARAAHTISLTNRERISNLETLLNERLRSIDGRLERIEETVNKK